MSWKILNDLRQFFLRSPLGSPEIDNDGRPVLRTIDAAPYAYDADRNLWKVTREQNKEITLGQDIEIGAGGTFTYHLTIPEYHYFCVYGRCDERHDFDLVLQIRTIDYTREISDPTSEDPWDGGYGSRKTLQFEGKNGFFIGPLVALTSVITVQIQNRSQSMQRWELVRARLFGGNG